MLNILQGKRKKGEYIKFIYKVYSDDENFVDTSFFHLKNFLYGKGTFARESFVQAIQIVDDTKQVLCQCMLIIPRSKSAVYLAYFDALESQHLAVSELMEYAKSVALSHMLDRIIIGINGHICYGAGILLENTQGKISFDSPYNKLYYKEYFDKKFVEHGLKTYFSRADKVIHIIEKLQRFIPSSVVASKMNMRKFRLEIERFRGLTNHSLIRTDFYEELDKKVFFELIGQMKPLLKAENLIFLLKSQQDIGFLFWHPDFNSVLKGGKSNNIIQVYLSQYRKINTIKLNTIGGMKGERIFLPLANALSKIMDKRFEFVESNFVWDSNFMSHNSLRKAGFEECRKYCVYEWRVNAKDFY